MSEAIAESDVADVTVPGLIVHHVRQPSLRRVEHAVVPSRNIIHVAFNNWIEASEKRVGGGPYRRYPAGRIVARSMLLPAGVPMSGWTIGQVDFLSMQLHPDAVRAAHEESGGKAAVEVRAQSHLRDPVLWHLACVLRADLAAGCPGGQTLRDGVQGVIARHLFGAGSSATGVAGSLAGPLSAGRLRAVREFVRSHLGAEIRLAELAAVAGLSPFHFSRAFKAATGLPPYRYVLEERLAAACRLLEATTLPVREIAALTGFETTAGFGASFKRRVGVAPNDYRRSVQE